MSDKTSRIVIAIFAIPIGFSYVLMMMFMVGIFAFGLSLIALVAAVAEFGPVVFLWALVPIVIIALSTPFMAALGEEAIDYLLFWCVLESFIVIFALALLSYYFPVLA